MTDIVDKLRSQIGDDVADIYDREALFRDAAAEIMRLRAELAEGGKSMSELATLADDLPAEIKRVQARRERWLDAQREASPRVMFGPALMIMQMAIDEGISALASGDVARMLEAHAELKDFNDDD